jgi:transcriptional regulator with PAS, ATPase and Fis domain
MQFADLVKNTEFDLDSVLGKDEAWIVILDKEQRVVDCNGGCRRILGVEPGELIGKRLAEEVRLGHLAGLLARGHCFRSQPLLIADRKLICQHVPRVENGRHCGGVLAVSLDFLPFDDLSQVELDDVVRSLSAVMDLAYEGTILVDPEGTIVLVNQAFADLLGTRAQDMVGKHIHKAYPNSKLSRLPVVMQTGLAEVGWPHVLNGREVVVCRYPLVKNGVPIGALGKIIFQDVQEVIRMADKFQAMTRAILKSAPQVTKLGDFSYDINSIVGHSKVMKSLRETILRVAERSSNILLMGESGTGKELFAHAIHAASKRRHGPFIKMNCAAIPEHLLESELFGYVDGAFTGAKRGGQIGKFELAHNGTIFLDEISDMTLQMQAKLLRILQEKELTPLGSNNAKLVDVRIIAATNVQLEEQVAKGKFREDLYYRLNVMALSIPPLRERTEDIYFLVSHFVESYNTEFGLEVEGLEPDAWAILKSYDYPGNIRELRNVIESAFNVVVGPMIRREDLPPHLRHVVPNAAGAPTVGGGGDSFLDEIGRKPLTEIMDSLERRLLERALQNVSGNKLQAASLLGISRPGFYKKLQKLHMS